MINVLCIFFGLCYILTSSIVTLALTPDSWAIVIGGAGLGIGLMLIRHGSVFNRTELLLFISSLGLQLAILAAPRA